MSESYIDAPHTPEQAHGDALAALDELQQFIVEGEEGQFDTIRKALTGSGGDYHEGFEEGMRAALASATADGWKLVPVEPTDEMLDVTVVAAGDPSAVSGVRQRHKEVYRAMIAAAPQRGGNDE